MPAAISYILYTLGLNVFLATPWSDPAYFGIGDENNNYGRVLGAAESVAKPLDTVINTITKGLPENSDKPLPPQKKIDCEDIDISAESALAFDVNTKSILFQKDIHKIWPIASITKLMTALVFLENNPGWDTIYKIQKDDRREGGKIYLYLGEEVSIKDLFYTSLVGSANTATIALVHSTGMTEEEFVAKMNEKAQNMGLEETVFYDPVGLEENTSTAWELVEIVNEAMNQESIKEAVSTSKYEFETLQGKTKIIENTDALLEDFPQNGIKILGGKTGYNGPSGYCFSGMFSNENGNEVISVVLGTDNINSRFSLTKKLVEWVYNNYEF